MGVIQKITSIGTVEPELNELKIETPDNQYLFLNFYSYQWNLKTEKNVVQTPLLDNRLLPFIEFVGNGPTKITINGIYVSNPKNTINGAINSTAIALPNEDDYIKDITNFVKNFKDILEHKYSGYLTITNQIFNSVGIRQVVVENYELDSLEGENALKYKIVFIETNQDYN